VPDDIEVQLVLKEINVPKGTGSMFAAVGSFSDEVTVGYSEGEPSCTQEGDVIKHCGRQDDRW